MTHLANRLFNAVCIVFGSMFLSKVFFDRLFGRPDLGLLVGGIMALSLAFLTDREYAREAAREFDLLESDYRKIVNQFGGNQLLAEDYLRSKYIRTATEKGDDFHTAQNSINDLIRIGRKLYAEKGPDVPADPQQPQEGQAT